jgi:catechol 2,3-dioxygenase-like lactoylglutathione lyase family enzyme
MSIVPIRGLFEAHLTVSDLERSIAFYRDLLGLPLAHRIDSRQVAFFWVPAPDKAMLGLWSIGTSPLRLRLHIAFDVALPQVIEAVAALRRAGITPRSLDGAPVDEPVVLGWMPAASVYFDDPDGHSLEFISMLDEAPRPELGQVSWSEWRRA